MDGGDCECNRVDVNANVCGCYSCALGNNQMHGRRNSLPSHRSSSRGEDQLEANAAACSSQLVAAVLHESEP